MNAMERVGTSLSFQPFPKNYVFPEELDSLTAGRKKYTMAPQCNLDRAPPQFSFTHGDLPNKTGQEPDGTGWVTTAQSHILSASDGSAGHRRSAFASSPTPDLATLPRTAA